MGATTICISQSTGSGGIEVGRLVAMQLGFRHVDEEIIVAAADKAHVDPEFVADVERRRSFFERIVEQMGAAGSIDSYPGLFVALAPSGDRMREAIREAIRDAADAGNVVIVSHGAAMALVGAPDVLRVLITASPEIRARRLADADVLVDLDEMDHRLRDSDKARAQYFRSFYGIDEELPTHYDLVVSTDVFSIEDAAALVVAAASRL